MNRDELLVMYPSVVIPLESIKMDNPMVEWATEKMKDIEGGFTRYLNQGFLKGRGPLFDPLIYAERRVIRREKMKRRLIMRGKRKRHCHRGKQHDWKKSEVMALWSCRRCGYSESLMYRIEAGTI